MSPRHDDDNPMPRNDTSGNETDLSDNPSRLRLFEQDNKLAGEIVREVEGVMPDITIQTVLRDAIHTGLPIVRKKLNAMCEAAKKNS